MIPLLSLCQQYSEDEEAGVVEAAWKAVSAVAVAVVEAAEVEPFSLSIAVVVFVEIPLFHPYCLRLERTLMLMLNEGVVEVEVEPTRYLRLSQRLSGWSCSRTLPRREPAIVVASSLLTLLCVRFVSRFESGGF
jgi:hypothetical protein